MRYVLGIGQVAHCTFGEDRKAAIAAFRCFVIEGTRRESPWAELKNQIYLGTEAFIREAQRHIPGDQPLQDTPEKQKRPPAKPLGFYAEKYSDRAVALVETYRSSAYRMREIGDFFGVSRMAVSRAVRQFGY